MRKAGVVLLCVVISAAVLPRWLAPTIWTGAFPI
jgi:hypothetical protein